MKDPEFETGQLLAGKYRVDKVLGRGGVGLVVSAMHVELNKKVAIKFLRPEALASADAVERFTREARAAAMIHSEHVARVHDIGKLDTGAPYMVMEFLEGKDLDQLLADGPLPVDVTVEYMLQACEALAEAHKAGIVHRDLKPANLFLTHRQDGSALLKIIDFGISKASALTPRGSDPVMSRTTDIMGSPGYMSPEQMRSTRDVDARADIWALGSVMYELLTARPAFVADSIAQLFFKVTELDPEPIDAVIEGVPSAVIAIVTRCMEKKPADRYADVAELATALIPFAPPRASHLAQRVSRVLYGQTKIEFPNANRDSPFEAGRIVIESEPGAPRVTGDSKTLGAPSDPDLARSASGTLASRSEMEVGSPPRGETDGAMVRLGLDERTKRKRRVLVFAALGVLVGLGVGATAAIRAASVRAAQRTDNSHAMEGSPTAGASASPPMPGTTGAATGVVTTTPPTVERGISAQTPTTRTSTAPRSRQASGVAATPRPPPTALPPSAPAAPPPPVAPPPPATSSLPDFGDRK